MHGVRVSVCWFPGCELGTLAAGLISMLVSAWTVVKLCRKCLFMCRLCMKCWKYSVDSSYAWSDSQCVLVARLWARYIGCWFDLKASFNLNSCTNCTNCTLPRQFCAAFQLVLKPCMIPDSVQSQNLKRVTDRRKEGRKEGH